MLPFSVICGLIFLFVIWNNTPDLVEMVGTFLVAHAKAIRSRRKLYDSLKTETAKV